MNRADFADFMGTVDKAPRRTEVMPNFNAMPPASAAEGQRARKAAALHESSTPKEPEQERWAGKQAGRKSRS